MYINVQNHGSVAGTLVYIMVECSHRDKQGLVRSDMYVLPKQSDQDRSDMIKLSGPVVPKEKEEAQKREMELMWFRWTDPTDKDQKPGNVFERRPLFCPAVFSPNSEGHSCRISIDLFCRGVQESERMNRCRAWSFVILQLERQQIVKQIVGIIKQTEITIKPGLCSNKRRPLLLPLSYVGCRHFSFGGPFFHRCFLSSAR
ncbi:hypothetical protein F2P81_023749 [Scophthalmus maximus]|uniref:Uncharacterized protein n=1 Tax=Scophthalmus maximus TaxID=52904 RepID=A0A6A4RS52_SCOMX|nr:hypothetical protein F2P81_023749 [Scophthalmus maximus]